MWIRCFHAHALLHASILQSTNAFCQDCNVVIHLDESVAHAALLKRCFPAFPEQRTRQRGVAYKRGLTRSVKAIFVTWEQYTRERCGNSLPGAYRPVIRETVASSPAASCLYRRTSLAVGEGTTARRTDLSLDLLVRKYERYCFNNGFTHHLRTFVLSRIHSASALLLAMRVVHARLRSCIKKPTET
jgi:hypothetical protein